MSERLTQVTIVDKDILELGPGEMTCDLRRQYWFIACPTCKVPGSLQGERTHHTVTEQDGLVTISQSLLCKCGAHYFIKQNKIEWC